MQNCVLHRLVVLAVICAGILPVYAQHNGTVVPDANNTSIATGNPLDIQNTSTLGGVRLYNCTRLAYYGETAQTFTVADSVPSKVWAVRMLLPQQMSAVYCTVWTVETSFYYVQKHIGACDTLHIFMREVYPPYNEFYHSKYLVRLGNNTGAIEIDPPLAQFARPVINPFRDVYVGVYITGTPGNQVTWRMKQPVQFGNSYIFTSPTTPVPVSGVQGAKGDLVFASTFCPFLIPVELSLFRGSYTGEAAMLEWRTESETNNAYFEVQRAESPSGPWIARGCVAGKGNTLQAQRYTFSEPLSSDDMHGEYWYRLRQVDFDGTAQTIPPVRIELHPSGAANFRLRDVYPNPVLQNECIFVDYELPAETGVRIEIFDKLGNRVATLADGVQPSGFHETLWYPGMGKTGVYFVVMHAGVHRSIRKVTILK